MNNVIDISEENDLDKLKALAYDTILAIEANQNSLGVIQNRIAKVTQDQAANVENEDNTQPPA